MTIQWVESVPSGTSKVGNAPTDFRSVWTAISTAMAREHYWPGIGGGSDASAGDLLPGGSRCFVGAYSASSLPASQGTGRLFLDITNSRLYIYESAASYLGGTSWFNESQSDSSSGYWVRTSGSLAGVSTGSATTVIAFGMTFLVPPSIIHVTGSNTSWDLSLTTSTTTNFTSAYSSYAGAASTLTIYWQALGILSSVSY